MQQLSRQDAVFLSIETPELPAHIGGLALLEPKEDPTAYHQRFVEFVRTRLSICERFSWRVQEVPFGLDRPYWVEVANFDVEDHIQRAAVASPGGPHELSKLTGLLFERPLDRRRPLWEMFLIEGLRGGRSALLWKVHHALMDGSSGANLVQQLFDLSEDAPAVRDPLQPPRPAMADAASAGKPVSPRHWVGTALRNAAELPRTQGQYLERAARKLLAPRSGEMAIAKPAPRASFNGRVGKRRRLVWSTVSLDDVKKIKSALSVTVNDVILAMTAGAVRSYLQDRNALPNESLIASVPSSTRSADDHALGNQLRDLSIPWATHIADPIERVLAIHANATRVKAGAQAEDSFSMMSMLADTMLPGTLQWVMRGAASASDRIPLPSNAVVSNVPMSPFPLYCAGARISEVIPFSLLGPTQGLNITVVSYCGQLHFGLAHDPELLPDAWALAELIPKDFQRLQGAVDQRLNADGLGDPNGNR